MRRSRFYCPELPERGELSLPSEEVQHIQRVLRLKPGAEIELFDGLGHSATALLLEVSRRQARARVVDYKREDEAQSSLRLLVAPPKGRRGAYLVEKLTELGATELQPLLTERGELTRNGALKELDAWRRRSIEAAKQCGRNLLPQLTEACEVAQVEAGGLALLADPRASTSLWSVLERSAPGPVVIAVGPEGGFTENEEQVLRDKGFQGVRLGSTILRIETAALALAAVVMAQRTDSG